MRRRVAHITFGLDVGGLEKLLVQFAEYARKDQFQWTFISLGHSGPIGEELSIAGHRVISLGKPSGWRPSLWWDLYRLFRREQFDAVHTHDSRPMIYAAPAAKWAGIPKRVHTQHGRVLADSDRGTKLVRRASRSVTDLVCVSQNIREVVESADLKSQSVWVVRNGISPKPYQQTESTEQTIANQNRDRVVCIARLSPEKGVDTLVSAAGEALKKNPEIRFAIAGDGACREPLQQKIDELKIGDQVELLGNVSDIPSLLSRARVFVLPSNSEGISLTLLEAMFARVPIVATSVGGTPEVICDDVTGRLVEPRQPSKMSSAILQLWDDGQRGKRFTEAAFDFANQNFSVDAMIQQYAEIYEATV